MHKAIHDQKITMTCPACSGSAFESLIDFGMVPHSGTFLSGPDRPYQMGKLSFEFCPHCALIRRQWPNENITNYANIGRTTSHCIPDYAAQIVESLKQQSIRAEELIVEVGANDGAFLDLLAQAGYTNRLGIEPSLVCASACSAKGHKVGNVYLDEREAIQMREQYGPAKVVICRHTLEHVPTPLKFLLAMKSLLCEDGNLFLEVPDSRSIICDMRGHELLDDHLHNFTQENLLLLMRRSGFRMDRTLVLSYRGTKNILLWCRPGFAEAGVLASSTDVQACRSFTGRWAALCERIQSDSANWPNPIVCLGASHLQTNFLLFTGLGRYIAFLVDDDPFKIGCYAPIPRPVPIISTDQFLNGNFSGTIIRAAFGYTKWMDKICKYSTAKVVDPLGIGI